MKRNKSIWGGILTISILFLLIKWSEYVLRPSDIDQCTSAIEAFHSMPEEVMDVIIYGSSHAWRGVNPTRMYEMYGIGAYNYGANWQTLSTEALFLFDSLRTQKPKVVLVETYRINDVLIDTDLNGEIYYTREISDFPKKREYLHRAFENEFERYFAYFFPMSQFHSSWSELAFDNFVTWYTKEDFVNTMGYFYLPFDKETPIVVNSPETFKQTELGEEATKILDEIVEICQEEEIELILFTVPWEGENEYHDALEQYSIENGCVYLDLFTKIDEMRMDLDTDFYDSGHLNNNGAIKVADYLGNYLKKNYELEDKRKIQNNIWMNKSGNRTGNRKIQWENKSHS